MVHFVKTKPCTQFTTFHLVNMFFVLTLLEVPKRCCSLKCSGPYLNISYKPRLCFNHILQDLPTISSHLALFSVARVSRNLRPKVISHENKVCFHTSECIISEYTQQSHYSEINLYDCPLIEVTFQSQAIIQFDTIGVFYAVNRSLHNFNTRVCGVVCQQMSVV